MVEEFAAIRPPTIRPTNPAGRNLSIAGYAMSWPSSCGSRCGNAFWMSDELRIDDHRARAPTRIHGHGRST